MNYICHERNIQRKDIGRAYRSKEDFKKNIISNLRLNIWVRERKEKKKKKDLCSKQWYKHLDVKTCVCSSICRYFIVVETQSKGKNRERWPWKHVNKDFVTHWEVCFTGTVHYRTLRMLVNQITKGRITFAFSQTLEKGMATHSSILAQRSLETFLDRRVLVGYI